MGTYNNTYRKCVLGRRLPTTLPIYGGNNRVQFFFEIILIIMRRARCQCPFVFRFRLHICLASYHGIRSTVPIYYRLGYLI